VVVVDGGDEERGKRGRRGWWGRHFMAGEGIVITKLSLGVMILDLGGANQNCTKKGERVEIYLQGRAISNYIFASTAYSTPITNMEDLEKST
jgi:hypothetical protein